ncbi:MAG: DinB family protein [Acidobacteriaceae bacterium]|nr:DinB family protein [Acidobacteriaceae bacterium]
MLGWIVDFYFLEAPYGGVGGGNSNMTKDDIQLLYKYDRWANGRVLQAASALSPEEFTRDLGGSFGSVRDTLVHVIGGEWIWLQYWKEPFHSSTFLTELRARRDVLFSADAFPDLATVRSKWAEVEKDQIEFVNRVTSELLEKMLPFRDGHVSLAHLMQHLANHSTYHRGQVALMMRQLGSEPVATDFHVFLAEGRATAS